MFDERIILAGWLRGMFLDDMDRLKSDDFTGENRKIAEAIRKVGADIYAVSRECGVKEKDLAEMLKDFAPMLYQQSVRHMIEQKARKYLAGLQAKTPLSEVVETLQKYIAGEVVELPEPESNPFMAYIQELDRRKREKVINTGLASIDNLLCGIRTQELTTIAARPSGGKSALCLQIGMNIAKQGKKVLFFPLEMNGIQTTERILQSKLDIPQSVLRKGELNVKQWEKLNIAIDESSWLTEGNFIMFPGENNIEVIRQLIKKYRPYAVIIDQLEQLDASVKWKDKRERFSYMTRTLKRLSMTENIAVLLAAQLNRGAQEVEPNVSHLKESGSIEEDSDNILMIHRIPAAMMENPEDWSEEIRPVLLKVEKQRNGATGSVSSKFVANKFTFYDVDFAS